MNFGGVLLAKKSIKNLHYPHWKTFFLWNSPNALSACGRTTDKLILMFKLSPHIRWRLTLDTWAGERSREGLCHWQQEVFQPPRWGRLYTSLVVSILMGIRNAKIGSFHGIQSKKSGKRQDVYWRSGLDTRLFPYRPQWSILIAKKKNEFAMQNKYI